MTTFFKIQSKKTGLFSTGGQEPQWSSVGKIWPMKGHLSSHFSGLTPHGRREYEQHEAKIVECQFEVLNEISVDEYVKAAKERKDARNASAKAARLARQEAVERAEYERLARRFGKL